MSLIVQKFGGSSLADAERIQRAAHIIREAYDAGNDVIAVVSAQGDTTDALLEKAEPFRPSARELDALLSTGEAASAALTAMALRALGTDAVPLCAWQIPIRTEGEHGDARIAEIGRERIERELRAGRAVVVAGFQGVNDAGDITTLGRGGSDTTAAALAAAFGAERCRIYTDVDGVYTADPRICPDARRLDEISYAHMRTLFRCGAQVLHGRCAEIAERASLALEVRSCEEGSVGTLLTAQAEEPELVGAARLVREGAYLASVTVVGRGVPSLEAERRMHLALQARGIEVFAVDAGEDYLTVFVPREDADEALRAVHAELLA